MQTVKEVWVAGELSRYLVDTATGKVLQIKTSRATGCPYATNISASAKADKIRKLAGL